MDPEIWSQINLALSGEEAVQFNEWRAELYELASRVRDESYRQSASIEFTALANELVDFVCQVPRLET